MGAGHNRKEATMDDLWDVDRFGTWYYGRLPTKSQRKELNRKCRDGLLPAVKVSGKWFIDTLQVMKGVRDDRERSGAA